MVVWNDSGRETREDTPPLNRKYTLTCNRSREFPPDLATQLMESNTLVDTLRILIVGGPEHLDQITSALTEAGHKILPVCGLNEASEALLIQRFDAVLLGAGIPAADIPAFTATLKDLDRRSGSESKTAVLSVVPGPPGAGSEPARGGIDGVVPETIDPDALTLAIARLATAVGTEHANAGSQGGPEVPILDIEQLREQVAFDDELLVELIDLFFSERLRQSAEMQEALRAGDYERLSRIAHTIKGSLASLHAMVAKEDAQNLELSAHNLEAASSERFLASLERNLNILEGHLLGVRNSVGLS
jgi:two-component system, sensor histidine kinase and response regulator